MTVIRIIDLNLALRIAGCFLIELVRSSRCAFDYLVRHVRSDLHDCHSSCGSVHRNHAYSKRRRFGRGSRWDYYNININPTVLQLQLVTYCAPRRFETVFTMAALLVCLALCIASNISSLHI